MGLLYDVSLPALMAFSVASHLVAVPILAAVRRNTSMSTRVPPSGAPNG